MQGNDKDEVKYCAITEQGDLGLGAELFNDADQKILKEAAAREKKENK